LSFQLSQSEGSFLVKLARKAVEEYLKTGKRAKIPMGVSEQLLKPCGVFVTINKLEGNQKALRGCIGFPYPTTPLVEAVVESAISAATQDPRFPPVSLSELDHVVFEVSVLTPPETVDVKNAKEYCAQIKVGEDGLIVERGVCKGLLLPQVPVEWEWDEETFLCQCCLKAGLPPDSWLVKGTKIYKFSSIIAEELSPKGDVVMVDMRKKTGTKQP
jgi:uncharacterized protein (TIGR00296 family)